MSIDPRTARLKDELELMKKLQSESGLIQIKPIAQPGLPPEKYQIIFKGKSKMLQGDKVVDTDQHQAVIELGMDWPLNPPLIYWFTPIFHPNFKMPNVCLQGKPHSSLTHLDQICEMLWDMLTFKSYNTNLDPHGVWDFKAAEWVIKNKDSLPTDNRDLRNLNIVIRIKESDIEK